ncbi:MAG TPA: ribosome maturation factor RimM [Vicinamibacteria bacterium]|nr:ribosome maturation factor RimM [Vicinamibacteria bacterium]
MARAWADLVAVGRVVKPQGRKGEVAVEPLTDNALRFDSLRRAFLPGPDGSVREVEVESSWPHKGRFVVKLKGVDSIDDAERLRDQELRIAEEELERLPEGSYYHHQLKGLEVVDEAGKSVGRAEDILETGGEAPVLVVKGPLGRETLVPLAGHFVKTVDLEAKRIVIAPPEYVDAPR